MPALVRFHRGILRNRPGNIEERTTPMKSFLERRDRWGNGYSLWLVVAIVFLIPVMGWSLSQIHLENDVAGWLPEGDPQSRILTWYQDLFPSEDRVLVSWDDCTLTDPRLHALCVRLEGLEQKGQREGGSPYIHEVTQPADLLRRMMSEGISFETALQRVEGLLLGRGPLCVSLAESVRADSEKISAAILKLASEQHGLTVQTVTRPMPEPSDQHLSLEDEKSWKLHDALKVYVNSQRRPDLQLYWPRMHIDTSVTDAFLKALTSLQIAELGNQPCIEETWYVRGSMAALSVTFSDAGIEDHSQALAEIQSAAEGVGIPAETLHLGGRPVAGTAMNEAVKHAGWNRSAPAWNLIYRSPLLLSVMVSVLLSYLMLKSFRLCVLVQTISIASAVTATSLVAPTGGSMNMVLIVMPTLLMVISVSGSIHICNYWKNSGIDDPAKSVVHAASVAWLPCFLASSTTAIGLASLMVSSLVPVRDFGIYASIGCVISFGFVLYLLPALMLYWPARPPRVEHASNAFWNRLGQRLSKHSAFICLLNLVLTAACLCGFLWFRTETKVIRYFPDESKVVLDYNFLEQNLSGIVSVDTLVRFNTVQQKSVPFLDRARKVLEVQEALRQHSEVSGTLSLASFLNLEKPNLKSMSIMERRNARLRENLTGERIHEKIRQGGEEANGLASMIALPDKSADWKRTGDQILNVAGDEIWRITCQSSILSDYDYGRLTRELAVIAENHLQTFPEGKPAHVVTGLIPIFLRTQQALLESLINSFGMAFVIIGIVMIFLLRSVTAALYSMIPNVFPIAIMFGLLGWGNIHVDIGTMITASVALGIAVDGTLHLITWFRQLIREGHSREVAVAKALEHCGPALWQTSAAVGFGMLTLYPVELLLISRFGWIMCGLIFSALWGDVILLPSLLAGPLGASLEKAEKKRMGKNGSDSKPSSGVMSHLTSSAVTDSDFPDNTGIRAACAGARAPHYPRLGTTFPRPLTET